MERDPQVSPEEIMSREVELGCESWSSFASGCSSTAVGGKGAKERRLDPAHRPGRPRRPWTAARTMEELRLCPLAIAQQLVYHAITVSTAVRSRDTRTMSAALLLRNNPKRKNRHTHTHQKQKTQRERTPLE